MLSDVSEVLLRDLARHDVTAAVLRRLRPQSLVTEAMRPPREHQDCPSLRIVNLGETQQ